MRDGRYFWQARTLNAHVKRCLRLSAGGSLLVLVSALPLWAQTDETPEWLELALSVLSSPAEDEHVVSFATSAASGLSQFTDPVSDFEHPTGEDPGYTPVHVDILEAWLVSFDPGPLAEEFLGSAADSDLWAPTGPLHIDPLHTFTGSQPFDGTQHDAGSLMFAFDLAGPPEFPTPGRCEYSVWVHDASRGPTFVNLPSFPGDPAAGTNIAFGLRVEPEGQGLSSTFTLALEDGAGFAEQPHIDVRSLVSQSSVVLFVPANQIGELVAVNFHSFCMESEFTFEPEKTGADQTGLGEIRSTDLGRLSISEAPVVATSVIQSTTTSLEPVTTSSPAEEVTSADNLLTWLIVFLLGGSALSLSGWLIYKRRDPCRLCLKQWKAARRTNENARQAVDEAIEMLESTDADLEELELKRQELCESWPPACWTTEDGGWIEDKEGNRMTSLDVHVRKIALGEAWDDYKAGKLTAGEIESRWKAIDTPQLRDEMEARDQHFRARLEEIDSGIADLKIVFDETFASAQELQAKAEESLTRVTEAQRKHEECTQGTTAGSAATSGQ